MSEEASQPITDRFKAPLSGDQLEALMAADQELIDAAEARRLEIDVLVRKALALERQSQAEARRLRRIQALGSSMRPLKAAFRYCAQKATEKQAEKLLPSLLATTAIVGAAFSNFSPFYAVSSLVLGGAYVFNRFGYDRGEVGYDESLRNSLLSSCASGAVSLLLLAGIDGIDSWLTTFNVQGSGQRAIEAAIKDSPTKKDRKFQLTVSAPNAFRDLTTYAVVEYNPAPPDSTKGDIFTSVTFSRPEGKSDHNDKIAMSGSYEVIESCTSSLTFYPAKVSDDTPNRDSLRSISSKWTTTDGCKYSLTNLKINGTPVPQ